MPERSALLTGAGWIAIGPPGDAGAQTGSRSDFDATGLDSGKIDREDDTFMASRFAGFDAADQDGSTLSPAEVDAYR